LWRGRGGSKTPSQKKYPTQKIVGEVPLVVEHPPSKYEAMRLNPSAAKGKRMKLYSLKHVIDFLNDDHFFS
jgi:hypothetical protein